MKRIKRITAWFLCILMLGSVPICAVEQPVGGETSLGCSECGQVEGHYATCNLYTCSVCGALLNQMGWVHNEGCANTPAQSVGQDMTADYSGSVGMLAAFHAFSETNPNGFPYFSVKADPKLEDQDEVNLRVISVEDEDFQADLSMIVLDWYVDSQNGLWYKVTAADGHTMPDILTQFPWVFQDYLDESSAGNSLILTKPGSQEEPETEETLTDESMGVKVSGKFLEGTTLSVKSATLADVAKIDTMLSGIPEAHKVVDISLVKDGAEYQPNEKVAVTMNVSDVEPVGKDVLVYHVHEESAGTVTTEVLGPFRVNADGNITFTMDNFSYVIVFTADYSISGIEAFYPGALEGSDSTNDQLTFLGVYYDAQNIAHFLLAFAANSNAANAEAKFEHVTIDTHTYYKQDVTYKITDTKFANLTLKDETGNIVYTSPASNKKGYGGIFDITLGLAKIRDGFFVGVNNQNTGNGWRIGGNLVLDLDYELIKTVAVGTSALGAFEESVVIERGDWVIFRLNVNNKGGRPLTDMLVQDILPDGVFDMSTVQMSIDGEDGEIGNWEPFSSTLFADYSSAGGFSRKLYIKAQVNPNLAITSDTTYTNKATIDGMNMPTYEDTANIIVRAPGTGTLTVSKAVTSENPNDSAPDSSVIERVMEQPDL